MVNSKQKGAAFERSVCQRLSLWCSEGRREDIFWRSVMSGGRATLRSRKGRASAISAHAGDIIATDALGDALLSTFFIECKYYRDLELDTVLFGKLGKIDALWRTPRKQSVQYGKKPMSIIRQNQQTNVLLLVDRSGSALLRDAVKPGSKFRLRFTIPTEGIYAYFFLDLLTEVSYAKLRACLKQQ